MGVSFSGDLYSEDEPFRKSFVVMLLLLSTPQLSLSLLSDAIWWMIMMIFLCLDYQACLEIKPGSC